MAELFISINYKDKILKFTGDTFSNKEKIKQSGAAKWLSQEKAWELREPSFLLEETAQIFPDAIIIEGGEDGEEEKIKLQSSESEPNGLPKSFSVNEFSSQLNSALRSFFPGSFYIRGVVSKCKEYRGGRLYLDLVDEKDATAAVTCVVWSNYKRLTKELEDLGFKLETDLQIMLEVSIGLDSKSNKILLSVVSIFAPYTLSKVLALRELTNKRLKEERLFGLNKEKTLPFLPRRLGILTSEGGTVIYDFKDSLDVAKFPFELYWFPVRVQGQSAVNEIIKGIDHLNKLQELDAILLFRGGGSVSDLMVFNEYEVAKAICLSRLPIVAAIGHQEDQSSAQDVSCISLGVPKDVGRYFSDIIVNYRDRVSNNIQAIYNLCFSNVEGKKENLNLLSRSIPSQAQLFLGKKSEIFLNVQNNFYRNAMHILQLSKNELANFLVQIPILSRGVLKDFSLGIEREQERVYLRFNSLIQGTREKVEKASFLIDERLKAKYEVAKTKINSLEVLFANISPEAQLKRGFAIVTAGKSYIKNAKDAQKANKISIKFVDDVVKAEIID